MQAKANTKKHSVLISWMLSYSLVLIIPIIISAIVYYSAIQIIEKNTSSANISLLTQMKSIFEDQIQQANNLCLQINWNTQIKSLINTRVLQDSDHYTIYELTKSFRANNINPYYNNAMIYFKNSGTVLSEMGVTLTGDVDFSYQVFKENYLVTIDQWKNMLNGYHSSELIPIELKDGNNNSKEFFIYAQSLPMESPRQAAANVLNTHQINTWLIVIIFFNKIFY